MENEKDLTDAELATVMRVSVQTVYVQAKEGGTLNKGGVTNGTNC